MTFGEKLKKLRRGKSLTQEELAEKIYVTRTAISKWESDRGYPSIDSLKAIAGFFSVTVDELLSSDEILTIAEQSQRQAEKSFRDLLFGLLDICMFLFLFLPLFATKGEGEIKGVSLLSFDGTELYLKILYFAVVIGSIALGCVTLALQRSELGVWVKSKAKISLSLGVAATLLFIVSQQPYAAVLSFSLLAVKIIVMIKGK